MAEEETGELSEVYEALRRDAKELITDLESSIESRSSSATISLIAAMFVLLVTLGALLGKAIGFTSFLESEAVGILLAIWGLWEKISCSRLLKKYGGLFSAAKKLK